MSWFAKQQLFYIFSQIISPILFFRTSIQSAFLLLMAVTSNNYNNKNMFCFRVLVFGELIFHLILGRTSRQTNTENDILIHLVV